MDSAKQMQASADWTAQDRSFQDNILGHRPQGGALRYLSGKVRMVGDTGIEPVTFPMSRERSTAELIAHFS